MNCVITVPYKALETHKLVSYGEIAFWNTEKSDFNKRQTRNVEEQHENAMII